MRKTVVLICADAEWRAVRRLFSSIPFHNSISGEYFSIHINDWFCSVLHTGWGKIAAAAATQFSIDHFQPELLVNLGTCGGFAGQIERGEIILANRTVVYDIFEQMADFDSHIAHYATDIDLSWLNEPYPIHVRRTVLVSGDRDLIAKEVPELIDLYQAEAGDWESGAIAWIAKRNNKPLLILRGVSDLVGEDGSAAYGNLSYFENAADHLMERLFTSLPAWLNSVSKNI